jgi:hypothetical protein
MFLDGLDVLELKINFFLKKNIILKSILNSCCKHPKWESENNNN